MILTYCIAVPMVKVPGHFAYRKLAYTDSWPIRTVGLYGQLAYTDSWPIRTVGLYGQLAYTDSWPIRTVDLYGQLAYGQLAYTGH